MNSADLPVLDPYQREAVEVSPSTLVLLMPNHHDPNR